VVETRSASETSYDSNLRVGASGSEIPENLSRNRLFIVYVALDQSTIRAQQLYSLRFYSWSLLFRFAAPSGGQLSSVAFLSAPTLFAVF